MGTNKQSFQLHGALLIILLIGAVLAYSIGFSKEITLLIISGMLFELGLWIVLFKTAWTARASGGVLLSSLGRPARTVMACRGARRVPLSGFPSAGLERWAEHAGGPERPNPLKRQ